jgi:hypothetical protein
MRFGFVRVHDWVAECALADTSAFSAEAFYLEAVRAAAFRPD